MIPIIDNLTVEGARAVKNEPMLASKDPLIQYKLQVRST